MEEAAHRLVAGLDALGWPPEKASLVCAEVLGEAPAEVVRLGPRRGVLVWDVDAGSGSVAVECARFGAGSGSVAVECARFGAAVVALDRDPAQCARVAANARRHGAEVRVVGGAAPEALDTLPDPDAVFVGGGGLPVVSAVAARRPSRIVVALAAVQRAGLALEALADAGYRVDGTLLQASGWSRCPTARTASPPLTRSSCCGPTGTVIPVNRGRYVARIEHDHGHRTEGGAVIGLITVTAAGRDAAERLARAWPGEARGYPGPAATALPRAWAECDALVCFPATGATIRLIAPLLASKHTDPAVVCVDEASRHAIALLGGHGSHGAQRAQRAQGADGIEGIGGWMRPRELERLRGPARTR